MNRFDLNKHENDKAFKEIADAALDAARHDFLAFCLLVNQNFIVGPHLRLIADNLNALFAGDIKRLMIFMPPRSGKSLTASTYFPAFCVGHSPSWQIIGASHSSDLAQDFSREVRNLVAEDLFQLLFRGVQLRPDSRAANRWHTNHHGVYTAIGVGGKIAGRGANLASIDDPISEQDAYSKAKRESVNRWYPSGLRTRLMPNGRVVITMTRWHDADLAGTLLKFSDDNEDSDKWKVLRIPALLDEEALGELNPARTKCIEQGILPEDYPELEIGGSYWPMYPGWEHLDVGLRGWKKEELLQTKNNTPPHEWEALYMQRPSAEEGNIIKRKWWQGWTPKEPPTCSYVLMSMDTAFSAKESADFSAITTWGVFRNDIDDSPKMILLGAQRGRWEYPELRRKTFDLYNFHNPDAVLIEKKSSGQSLIQDLRESGVPVLEYDPEKDKVARAYACTPLFQGKRIWVPKGKNWAEDVIYECSVFPAGAHDDYVDTCTQAILWIKAGAWVTHPDDEWQYGTMNKRKPKRNYY